MATLPHKKKPLVTKSFKLKTEEEELKAAADLINKNIQQRIAAAADEYNKAVESIQKKYGVLIGISTPQLTIKPS